MGEDVIWHLLSIFNGLDSTLDAVSTNHPDGSHSLSIALSLKWVEELQ